MRRRVTNAAVGAVTPLAMLFAGAWVYTGSPLTGPSMVTGYFTDTGCKPVSQAAKRRVERALQQKPSPNYPRMVQLDNDKKTSPQEVANWDAAFARFAEAEASARGLHIVDGSENRRRIAQARDAATVLKELNDFSLQLGFAFTLQDHWYWNDVNPLFGKLTLDEIELEPFREGASKFIQTYSLVPREFFGPEAADLKEVRLVQDFAFKINGASGQELSVGAYEGYGTDRIYMKLTSFNKSPIMFTHELSHRLGHQLGGFWGLLRDPEMKARNPKDFNYGTPEAAGSSAVANPYGAQDVAEDSATTIEVLLSGISAGNIEKRSPEQRAKFFLWLGRFETQVPGITSLLVALANDPAIDQGKGIDLSRALAVDGVTI